MNGIPLKASRTSKSTAFHLKPPNMFSKILNVSSQLIINTARQMKKIKYTNPPKNIREAIKQSEVIEDFLPPPDRLVLKEDNIKVTLELSSKSVRLFKRYAKSKGFKYQRMIRNLIDQYADKVFSA